jgi:hypothetical protein
MHFTAQLRQFVSNIFQPQLLQAMVIGYPPVNSLLAYTILSASFVPGISTVPSMAEASSNPIRLVETKEKVRASLRN